MTATERILPPQFTPAIRVAPGSDAVTDGDVGQRIDELQEALGLSSGAGGDGAADPPLKVRTPEEILPGLPPAVARLLEIESKKLHERLDEVLPAAQGSDVTTYATTLEVPQEGFTSGSVVYVRDGDFLEQFIFPFLRANLADGSAEIVDLPTGDRQHQATHSAFRAMDITVPPAHGDPKKITGLLLSVAPFLPQPWGAVATGTLTLFNMFLDSFDDGSRGGGGTSQFTQLLDAIEGLVVGVDLEEYQGTLTGQASRSREDAKAIHTPIQEVTEWTKPWNDFRNDLDNPYAQETADTDDQVWGLLQAHDYDNGQQMIALLVQGVSLELLFLKTRMQVDAVHAAIAQKAGNLDDYKTYTQSWTNFPAMADALVGQPVTEAWTSDTIFAAIAGDPWVPRLTGWMEQARLGRLAKIDSQPQRYVQRGSYQSQGGSSGGSSTVDPGVSGWTWVDKDVTTPEASQMWTNLVMDSPPADRCHDAVQHQDVAQKNLDDYRDTVNKTVINTFASLVATIASWPSYVQLMEGLLPPEAPKGAPTVAANPQGSATPSGSWVSGTQVRYAFSAVSDKGPSSAGPYSVPMSVGATKGAVMSGLPAGTGDLAIYRQFRPAGATDWLPADQIDTVTLPATNYTDIGTEY